MPFPFAIMLCDMEMQPASVRLISSDFGQGHLHGMFYFVSETTRPGCYADYHFVKITLCLQKISKLIAKKKMSKNCQTANISLGLRTQGSDQDNFSVWDLHLR